MRRLRIKGIRQFIYFICIFALALLVFSVIYSSSRNKWNKASFKSEHLNYLLDQEGELDGKSFLVDTPTCQIPDLQEWADSIKSYFSTISTPTQDCRKFRRWTFVRNGNEISLNETEIERDGYHWTHISCCLTQITRHTQKSPQEQDKDADNIVKYSECQPLHRTLNKVQGEFYMVTCYQMFLGFQIYLLYRDFHALAPPPLSKGEENQNLNSTFPNVLILGIDSTSRLNFRRLMPRTVTMLQSLGAVELLGYTKVGDNTFPNFSALLAGLSEELLKRSCQTTQYTKLDDCPWIFKRFKKHNYITSLAEDSPFSTAFNHYRTGFVEQPVSHYFRPFMIAVHEHEWAFRHLRLRNYLEGCVGHRTNDEALLDYALSVMDMAYSISSPAFVMSWSSAASHDDVTGIAHSDLAYASRIDSLLVKGQLDNTLLIVMGDHGYRYGPVRETLQGWYEDKLPAVWIRLGRNIIDKFPEWETNLKTNSKRLASHFVLYETLIRILEAFSEQHGNKKKKSKIPNLLDVEIPLNITCRDVGIPDQYCACNYHYPHKVSITDDPNVQLVAEAAITHVNHILEGEDKCTQLTLGNVTLAGKMQDVTNIADFVYLVAFVTKPGDFLLETEMTYDSGSGRIKGTPRVHRANGMKMKDVDCLINGKEELELWCYCKR